MKETKTTGKHQGGTKVRRRMDAKDLSVVCRMLQDENFSAYYESFSGGGKSGGKPQHVLEFLYSAAQREQQETGVLLLDILALNDFITDLFQVIHDEMEMSSKAAAFLLDPPFLYLFPRVATKVCLGILCDQLVPLAARLCG